jgi:hypothetical protein
MERTDEALRALFRHPERTLLPWYRYALATALETDDVAAGRRARAWLDILAAQKALFCWRPLAHSPRHPVRQQPDALLALARETVRGSAEPTATRAALTYARAYCDVAGEPPESPHYAAWCVYESAVRALERACLAAGHPHIIMPNIDDAAGYAAIAIADEQQPAASDDARDGARLRRAVFWEWWLRDAVPTAIDLAER